MEPVNQIARQLLELKEQRADKLNSLYDVTDDIANCMIADALNILEQLFLILNMPQDGFVSSTPENAYGKTSTEAPSS